MRASLFMAVVLFARVSLACTSMGEPTDAKTVAANAPDVFSWFDSATSVAMGAVTKAPGSTIEGHGLAGDVVFTLSKSLKGTPPKMVTLQQAITPCGGYSTGMRRVVFLDTSTNIVSAAPIGIEKALVRYGAASATSARRQLLDAFAAGRDPLLAGAARKRLRHD